MDYLEYKGYKGTVEYSKEDDCLCGRVIGMSKDLILYEGGDISALKEDFKDSIDSYIDGCIADGIEPRKPFSGKMLIRMTSELHSRVATCANGEGIAINDFINRAIARELEYCKA